MTRREEIEKAATDYINSDAVSPMNMQLAFGDFINGAQWADKHPNWIKADSDKQPDAGQLCVISPKTPGLYYLARWNERTHIFEILDPPCGYYRSALNYWMPIVLPKEED